MAERAEKRAGMSVPHNAFGKVARGVSAAALTAAAIDAGYSAAASWATGDQFGKHELLTDVMSGDFPSVWEQIRSHAVTIVGADGKEQTIYPTPAPEIPTLQVPDEKTPTPVAPTPTPEATSTATPTETPTPEPTPTEEEGLPLLIETELTNRDGQKETAFLFEGENGLKEAAKYVACSARWEEGEVVPGHGWVFDNPQSARHGRFLQRMDGYDRQKSEIYLIYDYGNTPDDKTHFLFFLILYLPNDTIIEFQDQEENLKFVLVKGVVVSRAYELLKNDYSSILLTCRR